MVPVRKPDSADFTTVQGRLTLFKGQLGYLRVLSYLKLEINVEKILKWAWYP